MTILGARIEPGHALLWCDTQTFRDRRPFSYRAKMSINPLGMATIGCGPTLFGIETASACAASLSIDALHARLPAQLRKRASSAAPELTRRDQHWAGKVCILAAGFSPRSGRMIGWRLSGEAFFEPVLFTRHCVPDDESVSGSLGHIGGLHQVVKIARRQLGLFRERGGHPETSGGDLTVCEMLPDASNCWRVPDFDRESDAPFELIERTCHVTPGENPACDAEVETGGSDDQTRARAREEFDSDAHPGAEYRG